MKIILPILFFFCSITSAYSQTETFVMSLKNAEVEALNNSNFLKSFNSESKAAVEHADSQFAALYPHLTLDGNYHYLTEIPNLPGPNSIPLGDNSNFSVGPTLSYTLWDTGGARKAYRGLFTFSKAREEEQKSAKLQLLSSVRFSYVQVQLALKELYLVNESLELTRAQANDVRRRYHAGAAARIDMVTAERAIINYELQFNQKQAELSALLKDLLALIGNQKLRDVSHPGPADLKGVSLVLKLDPFEKLLKEENQTKISSPDNSRPRIRNQEFLAESSKLSAASQIATLFPTVQVSAKTSLDYPNGPIQDHINQNTLMASLTMPIFEGGRARHEAAARRKEAEAAKFRGEQLKVDLSKDFEKARELMDRLGEQQKLAAQDVLKSEEVAKLYYTSYKAGKINLIDVQSANLQALLSQVNSARIDAQILNQIITLKELSGKEAEND